MVIITFTSSETTEQTTLPVKNKQQIELWQHWT